MRRRREHGPGSPLPPRYPPCDVCGKAINHWSPEPRCYECSDWGRQGTRGDCAECGCGVVNRLRDLKDGLCGICTRGRCCLCTDGGTGPAGNLLGQPLRTPEEVARGSCNRCNDERKLAEAWRQAPRRLDGGAPVELHLSVEACRVLYKLAQEGKRAARHGALPLVLEVRPGEVGVRLPGAPRFSAKLSPVAAVIEPARKEEQAA